MPIVVISGRFPLPLAARHTCIQLAAGVACLIAVHGTSWAQNAPAATPAAVPNAAAPSSPQWKELTAAQQQSLSPLAASWATLGSGQRRKWIAMAQNYPSMAPAEQSKLHSRMAEWAALKPKDRELARLNFAETKKIAPSERAANWEAYQALSAEEKQKLAEHGARKPVGAAVAIKPVPAEKLAKVPVTRRTPEAERARTATQQAVNRTTLLPQPPAPVAPPVEALVPTADTVQPAN